MKRRWVVDWQAQWWSLRSLRRHGWFWAWGSYGIGWQEEYVYWQWGLGLVTLVCYNGTCRRWHLSLNID